MQGSGTFTYPSGDVYQVGQQRRNAVQGARGGGHGARCWCEVARALEPSERGTAFQSVGQLDKRTVAGYAPLGAEPEAGLDVQGA